MHMEKVEKLMYDGTIAIQGNIAPNPVHQNAKSSVSQLRRAPARHQLPSLSFHVLLHSLCGNIFLDCYKSVRLRRKHVIKNGCFVPI